MNTWIHLPSSWTSKSNPGSAVYKQLGPRTSTYSEQQITITCSRTIIHLILTFLCFRNGHTIASSAGFMMCVYVVEYHVDYHWQVHVAYWLPNINCNTPEAIIWVHFACINRIEFEFSCVFMGYYKAYYWGYPLVNIFVSDPPAYQRYMQIKEDLGDNVNYII